MTTRFDIPTTNRCWTGRTQSAGHGYDSVSSAGALSRDHTIDFADDTDV